MQSFNFLEKSRTYQIGKKLIIPRQLCLVSPMDIKVKTSVIVKLEQ